MHGPKSLCIVISSLAVFFALTLAAVSPARGGWFQVPTGVRDDHEIRDLENKVESAIVRRDTNFLQTVFADDFRYIRTTGQVETKSEWLADVAKGSFVSRDVVALEVEIHGNVAVTHGELKMTVRDEHGEHSNVVKYMQVYRRQSGVWQMLNHRSLQETAAKPVQ
jgi:ketosteroid isomerase-like protein